MKNGQKTFSLKTLRTNFHKAIANFKKGSCGLGALKYVRRTAFDKAIADFKKGSCDLHTLEFVRDLYLNAVTGRERISILQTTATVTNDPLHFCNLAQEHIKAGQMTCGLETFWTAFDKAIANFKKGSCHLFILEFVRNRFLKAVTDLQERISILQTTATVTNVPLHFYDLAQEHIKAGQMICGLETFWMAFDKAIADVKKGSCGLHTLEYVRDRLLNAVTPATGLTTLQLEPWMRLHFKYMDKFENFCEEIVTICQLECEQTLLCPEFSSEAVTSWSGILPIDVQFLIMEYLPPSSVRMITRTSQAFFTQCEYIVLRKRQEHKKRQTELRELMVQNAGELKKFNKDGLEIWKSIITTYGLLIRAKAFFNVGS